MCGIEEKEDQQYEENTESHVTIIETVHAGCNAVITSQMNAIQQLKNKVLKLEEQNSELKLEIHE